MSIFINFLILLSLILFFVKKKKPSISHIPFGWIAIGLFFLDQFLSSLKQGEFFLEALSSGVIVFSTLAMVYFFAFAIKNKDKRKGAKGAIFLAVALLFSFIPSSKEKEIAPNIDPLQNTAEESDSKSDNDPRQATQNNIEKPQEKNSETPFQNNFIEAVVTGVTDGDTITVSMNGTEHTVRLIGVDTPETKHPNKPVQFLGTEASEFTNNTLNHKTIYLEKDVSETDKYGRLLFYVWLAKPQSNDPTTEEILSSMFNARLLSNGLAKPATYPPDVKYQSVFSEISRNAQEQSVGIWSIQADPTGQTLPAPPKPEEQSRTSIADLPEIPVTTEEAYVGNSNTMKFHHKNCKSAKKIAPEHRVPFATAQDARNAGYSACKQCKP